MASGYGEELLGRVSGLVAACTLRVSRATRRLLRRHQRRRPTKHHHQTTADVVAAALCARGAAIDKGRVSASAGEVALWSRRILMGERCQPLDFAGAIHYDSFGRRLARPPVPPRSASSLSCSCRATTGDGDAGYYPAAENGDAV